MKTVAFVHLYIWGIVLWPPRRQYLWITGHLKTECQPQFPGHDIQARCLVLNWNAQEKFFTIRVKPNFEKARIGEELKS